jgi:RNA polymerase sigma factor (sigma-70 family)
MATLADTRLMTAQQDQLIAETVVAQEARLRRFIRRQVADRYEAEDILQEVFYELVDAYRLMKPIEQVGAWLMRIARNRIIDRFRKRKLEPLPEVRTIDEDGMERWDDLLPSDADGPAAAFAREVLMEQVEAAIAELPPAQRDVFIAHEIEGRSFRQLSDETGVSVNTLLSRKHAAVNALRQRLLEVYAEINEFGGLNHE